MSTTVPKKMIESKIPMKLIVRKHFILFSRLLSFYHFESMLKMVAIILKLAL